MLCKAAQAQIKATGSEGYNTGRHIHMYICTSHTINNKGEECVLIQVYSQ